MSDSLVVIQYVESADGAMIATGRRGSGPPVVQVPSIAGDVVDHSGFGDWLTGLGYEVTSYARRGVGLSARGPFAADGRLFVDDLRAVVDAIDADRYSILAMFVGSLEAMAVAATDDRVERLVLIDPLIDGSEWTRLPRVRAMRAALAEDWNWYTEAFAANAHDWRRVDGEAAAALRQKTTQEEMACMYAAIESLDISDLLPEVQARTLVVHRPSWYFPPSYSQRIASKIPNCELSVPRQGNFDRAELSDVIAEFLSASPSSHASAGTPQLGGFQSIVFTDIESSTALTQRIGDSAAHELLLVHDRAVRDAVEQYGGNEVKHTGDGIMASFDSAVRAVEASLAIQRTLSDAELRVRIGINAGEPIADDGDFFGTVVQLAARICERAEPGHVLISRVVADLCSGKNLDISHHSDTTLKGFAQPTALFEVRNP